MTSNGISKLYHDENGKTAYMFDTANYIRVSVDGERRDYGFENVEQAEAWLEREGYTSDEATELASEFTKDEYAEFAWESIKQFVAELDAEDNDPASKLMQMLGFVGTSAEVYKAIER